VGPCIETELEARKVTIETFVNGELRQKGNTADLIHTVPELLSYISQIMTLLPGDVIATGTPAGIGELHSGDTVEVKIAQIGSLRNFVVSQP
jgi:2-keto-4-pentenoate hydratase/2-oxohepta-3-ene-1,7-dioic acid hydratase in catechol pathway